LKRRENEDEPAIAEIVLASMLAPLNSLTFMPKIEAKNVGGS
jgi:hypothetical protein